MIQNDDEIKLNIGFKDPNDFSLYIETLKLDYRFDTYMETLVWYLENESDMELEGIVKYLNKKLKDSIEYEALQMNMLKQGNTLVSLFK